MHRAKQFRDSFRVTVARAFAASPIHGCTDPVFILGCGRSGTTALGTALSKHEQITYLNERRHLWFAAYPETDIWTASAASRNGKLVLTASDADATKGERLRRLFRWQALLARRPLVVEKLPINAFRLEFLQAIFPEARFIHIHRNGLEVARSIGQQAQRLNWFGANGYKWEEMVRYARRSVETDQLPQLCSNEMQKGLLEWRLGTEAIVRFLQKLPKRSYCELCYGDLVEHPAATILNVLNFLGLSPDPTVTNFAQSSIARASQALKWENATPNERKIGGPLLERSFESSALTKAA